MIVRFTSTEAGTIVMMDKTARTLLDIVGKEATASGVFTLEEMPAAIEKLKAAVKAEQEAASSELDDEDGDEDEKDEKKAGKTEHISLARRAFPLIEMLSRTAAAGREGHVMWEARAPF